MFEKVKDYVWGLMAITVAFAVPIVILYLAVCTNYAHYR